MEKIERQMNLVALLLNSRIPKQLDQIRDALYRDQPSEEAFRRMFERDKEELRPLGVRIEHVEMGWEEGYIVSNDATLLPTIDFTPAEHAALMIAAEAWGAGMLGAASPRLAAMKLSAVAKDDAPPPWIVPHVAASSPNLGVVSESIGRRKVITFRYRTGGGAGASSRAVEPHVLSFRSGAWYVTGLDRDRGERRSFKLDRIDGAVKMAAGKKEDFELPADPAPFWPEPEAGPHARVAVDPSLAWWTERRPGAQRIGALPDGRIELEVPVPDEGRFVQWVAGLGPDAELLEPTHLRETLMSHLRTLAGGG